MGDDAEPSAETGHLLASPMTPAPGPRLMRPINGRLRAVFLDLDDTLADSEASWRAAGLGALRDLGDPISPEIAQEVVNEYIQIARDVAMRNAWASSPRVQRFALALRRGGIDDDGLASRVDERFGDHLHDGVAFLPGAERLVEAAMSFSTCLISNGDSATQRETAHRLRLLDRFDHVLISSEVGAWKPDPEIFRLALDLVEAQPHEAVMIGDSLHADIAGAASLDISTVWINRHGWPVEPAIASPDLTVASPAEAAAVLESAGDRRTEP